MKIFRTKEQLIAHLNLTVFIYQINSKSKVSINYFVNFVQLISANLVNIQIDVNEK